MEAGVRVGRVPNLVGVLVECPGFGVRKCDGCSGQRVKAGWGVQAYTLNSKTVRDSGRGTTRADDAQGTHTPSHISPSMLEYKEYIAAA